MVRGSCVSLLRPDPRSGARLVEVSPGQRVFLAGPEKALLDLVYLHPGGDELAYLQELRLQKLERLDLDALQRMAGQASRHGATRRIFINNLFFGGKLPRFLGFDHPMEHIGSRATIPQAQLYRSAGRDNSFAATLRMICDFATREMHVNLSGGASGQRFSPYYIGYKLSESIGCQVSRKAIDM